MQTEIFDYGMNGEGVGKIDGKITLIEGALKGEVVNAKLINSYKTYNVAKLENIVTPCEARVKPPCPYFYKCGGCDLQHMKYAEQLNFKTELVKKTIKKICGLDVNVSPTVPSDYDYFYRNKTSFAMNEILGFYRKKSNKIVEIDHCFISNEAINKVLSLFKEYIKDKGFKKNVKHLVVRSIGNHTLVGVVANCAIEISDFYQILADNFKYASLYLIINKRHDSVILTPKYSLVGGEGFIYLKNNGINYSIDIIGFHQTNINVQDKLYSKVLDLISESFKNKPGVVINGYSGEGLLTALISQRAEHVYGIEINSASHQSAEYLKRVNNIQNMTNILGDFDTEYGKLKADMLVLDPTKKGVGKKTMSKLVGVKEIIYISCNPISLCRDLNGVKKHYDIECVLPFDMFPNTKSVETIVKLKYKGE